MTTKTAKNHEQNKTMVKFAQIIIAIFLSLYNYCSVGQTSDVNTLSKADSLILLKYKNEVIRNQASEEDSLMTLEDIEANWGNSKIDNGIIKYAPDSSFKIITFIVESCGAYCNSKWYSWIHYNLKRKEQIKKVDFYSIDTIYQLPEKKYLIIGSHGYRPAGVITVSCINPNLISFAGDSLIVHKIDYKNQKTENNSFGFCQENGIDIDTEPFIRYDGSSKILSYHFANNYAYSEGLDLDTVRQGQFIYTNGYFILEKETIKVQDNRTLPTKINEWTEIYKIRSTDTISIHIDNINGHQLVYDCIGCQSSYTKAIKVFSVRNGIKKELLTFTPNGAYLEKILLLEIDKNFFIYISSCETSGNSDGYFYYLNTNQMTAYEVEIDTSYNALPQGCEHRGSYAYLAINEDSLEISTTSQFIDTTSENRRGSVKTYYVPHKIKNNQFILKSIKYEVIENSSSNNKIYGKVTDKNTGEPLPYVNVVIDKSYKGSQTDFEGKYSIIANSDDTLIFSFAGMKTQKIKADKNEINVTFQEIEPLKEIVGPPYTPKKTRLIATTTITKKDIENADNPKCNFKKNAKNNVFVIFVSELTSYDFNKEDIIFQQKYSVKYSLIDNYKIDYLTKYNKLTFKHLKKKYKRSWLREIRKDAVGLEKE